MVAIDYWPNVCRSAVVCCCPSPDTGPLIRLAQPSHLLVHRRQQCSIVTIMEVSERSPYLIDWARLIVRIARGTCRSGSSSRVSVIDCWQNGLGGLCGLRARQARMLARYMYLTPCSSLHDIEISGPENRQCNPEDGESRTGPAAALASNTAICTSLRACCVPNGRRVGDAVAFAQSRTCEETPVLYHVIDSEPCLHHLGEEGVYVLFQ